MVRSLCLSAHLSAQQQCVGSMVDGTAPVVRVDSVTTQPSGLVAQLLSLDVNCTTAFFDPETRIESYDIALGSTDASADIAPWMQLGDTCLGAIAPSLTLL